MSRIQEEGHPIPGGNHSEGLPRRHKRRCPDLYAQLLREGRTKLVRKEKRNLSGSVLFNIGSLTVIVGIICRYRLIFDVFMFVYASSTGQFSPNFQNPQFKGNLSCFLLLLDALTINISRLHLASRKLNMALGRDFEQDCL